MHVNANPSCNEAFTMADLLGVIVILAFLATIPLHASGKAKNKAGGILCLTNHRQIATAWQIYSADNEGKVVNNFTIPDATVAITSRKFDTWANNIMTWQTTGVYGESVTNVEWVGNGPLGPYTAKASRIFQCPADSFVSPVQRKSGWNRRVRSVSMNALIGRSDQTSSLGGKSWGWGNAYRQYLKTSDFVAPAKTWVTVDEHPDGINDGFFINGNDTGPWADFPSAFHDGGCGFSFADGHAEIKKWESDASKNIKVTFGFVSVFPRFDPTGALKKDRAWYNERCGFIPYR